MTNHEITQRFFNATDAATKRSILKNIAANYGITPQEAEAEVTDPNAEHLLDMQRHGLA